MALRKCRECGGMVSSKAVVCQSCGHPVKRPAGLIRQGCGCLCACSLIIVFTVLLVGFLSKNSVPQADTQTPESESRTTSQTPREGDRITINTEMWLSVDEATHKESLKCVTAKDKRGLKQLEAQGRIFVVPAGTTGLLLEGGILTSRVRIQSGKHAGRAGYISSDFVEK